MRKPDLISCLFLLFLLFFLNLFFIPALSGCRQGKEAKIKEPPNPAHPGIFVTKEELFRYLAGRDTQDSQSAELRGRFISGVVPHHLVAGRLIVQFMEALSRQNPAVIVLAGPNHHNLGGRIITGLYDWQTPEGPVKSEAKIVRALLEKGLAVRDEEVLSQEHSVGALLPFIRHFMPQTRVVPLIFHHDVSLQEIDAVLEGLQPYLDGGEAVVVASVDFSHYLTRQEAQVKDELTLKVMREFDYTTLFKLGNEHLDSPASLAMAFREAQKRGVKEFDILGHSNSGIILKNDIIETTSYFTLVFRQ